MLSYASRKHFWTPQGGQLTNATRAEEVSGFANWDYNNEGSASQIADNYLNSFVGVCFAEGVNASHCVRYCTIGNAYS